MVLQVLVFILAVFLVVLFTLYWGERAKRRQGQPAYLPVGPKDLRPISCQRGEHDWRAIANPYVKQCKVKTCGAVVFGIGPNGEFPDGLKEYVHWFTENYKEPLDGDTLPVRDSDGKLPH
jgi:hypothetical protein